MLRCLPPDEPPIFGLTKIVGVRILYGLAKKGWIGKRALFHWLYGDDPDGGPLSDTIKVHIHYLRVWFWQHDIPITIKNKHGHSYFIETGLDVLRAEIERARAKL